MKKIITIAIAAAMLLSAGCAAKEQAPTTAAGILAADFESYMEQNPAATAQEAADHLLKNEVLSSVTMASMPVEPGLLMGFGESEITGFEQGVMIAPMIGTIPFIGYVFTLAGGSDAAEFAAGLEELGDTRWNICTEADEKLSAHSGGTVFFVMSPLSFEE